MHGYKKQIHDISKVRMRVRTASGIGYRVTIFYEYISARIGNSLTGMRETHNRCETPVAENRTQNQILAKARKTV